MNLSVGMRVRAAWAGLMGRIVRRTSMDSSGPIDLIGMHPARAREALSAASAGSLQGIADIYDLMPATDLHILGVRRQLIRRFFAIPYTVVAADEDPLSQLAAEICRKLVEGRRRSFTRVLGAAVEADLRGVAIVEVVWPDDTVSGPRLPIDFVPVLHQRIIVDVNTGEFRIRTCDTDSAGTPLSAFPPGKFIVFSPAEETANYSLRGVYRAILPEWLGRIRVSGWELTSIERFGMPIPIGKAATDPDQKTLETAFENFGAAGSIIVSPNADVTMAQTSVSQSGAIPHETFLAASARRISVGVLGAEQSVTVGADQGSQASAKSQTATTSDILFGLWEVAGEFIERDLFGPVTQYLVPGARPPTLVPNFDEPMDLKAATEALDILRDLFDVPVSWARKLTGAPEGEPGEDVLRPRPVAPSSPLGARRARAAAVPAQQVTDPLEREVSRIETEADIRALVTRLRTMKRPEPDELQDALAGEILDSFLRGATAARNEEPT